MKKPKLSWREQIAKAIAESKKHRLTVEEVRAHIRKNFASLKR